MKNIGSLEMTVPVFLCQAGLDKAVSYAGQQPHIWCTACDPEWRAMPDSRLSWHCKHYGRKASE